MRCILTCAFIYGFFTNITFPCAAASERSRFGRKGRTVWFGRLPEDMLFPGFGGDSRSETRVRPSATCSASCGRRATRGVAQRDRRLGWIGYRLAVRAVDDYSGCGR